MAGNYPGPSSSPMAHTGPSLAWLLPSTTVRNTHVCTRSAKPTWLVQALHRYTQVPSPTLSTLREDQSTRFR